MHSNMDFLYDNGILKPTSGIAFKSFINLSEKCSLQIE